MFAVDDLDDTLDRLREHGAQLVDEVVRYEDVYRLCYVRGPEGILIGLAEQIGWRPTRARVTLVQRLPLRDWHADRVLYAFDATRRRKSPRLGRRGQSSRV